MLDTLKRLGLEDDTIIVFTADHGDQLWEHRLFLKFVFYEASVHVPLFICGEGIEPGDRDEFVEHVDLFPTICDLAGATTPPTVHGRSLSPLLSGDPTPDEWRDAVFSQIRNNRMVRTADWKLNTYDGLPEELYDLTSDPDELENRIDDPALVPVREELLSRMSQWEQQTADPGSDA